MKDVISSLKHQNKAESAANVRLHINHTSTEETFHRQIFTNHANYMWRCTGTTYENYVLY